jgi:hypothetical protein
MSRRSKSDRTLGEHAIFGDEEAARLRSELDELTTVVRDLAERVHSQFTTIAAHAEIARTQSEHARAEARADLDRTRDTLIGLIEQLRTDADQATHVAGSAPGPSTAEQGSRVDAMTERLDHVTTIVDVCFARQKELADTMAAVIDTVFAEQRGEPVAGLSLS